MKTKLSLLSMLQVVTEWVCTLLPLVCQRSSNQSSYQLLMNPILEIRQHSMENDSEYTLE